IMDDLKKSGLKKDRGGGFFAAHKGGGVERGRHRPSTGLPFSKFWDFKIRTRPSRSAPPGDLPAIRCASSARRARVGVAPIRAKMVSGARTMTQSTFWLNFLAVRPIPAQALAM